MLFVMHDESSNFQAENRWIWAYISRFCLWAFSLSLLWSLPFTVVAVFLYWSEVQEEAARVTSVAGVDDGGFGDLGAIVILSFFVFLAISMALTGCVTGATASVYAPASPNLNPFASRFFRTVGRKTYLFCLWSFPVAIVVSCVLGLLLSLLEQSAFSVINLQFLQAYNPFIGLLLMLIPMVVAFLAGLSRAVRIAIHERE